MRRMTAFLAAILLLQACTSMAPPAPPGEDYFRERVDRDYVEPFRAGDIDRWIVVFAEDAVALHNRRPADEGRPAILAFGRMVAQHLRLERYDVEVREVRVSGDWALTRGSFVTRFVSRTDGSSPFGEERGKFLLVWARQADGDWKIVLDMGNSDGPVPPQ